MDVGFSCLPGTVAMTSVLFPPQLGVLGFDSGAVHPELAKPLRVYGLSSP